MVFKNEHRDKGMASILNKFCEEGCNNHNQPTCDDYCKIKSFYRWWYKRGHIYKDNIK